MINTHFSIFEPFSRLVEISNGICLNISLDRVSVIQNIVKISTMKPGFGVLLKFREVSFPLSPNIFSLPTSLVCLARTICSPANCSTLCQTEVGGVKEEENEDPKDSKEVLSNWGCSEEDISKLFLRRPSLKNANHSQLQSKLNLLRGLGVGASDLVKIMHCRPRFLSCRLNHCFDERLAYFMTLFESKEVLARAIVRNPSLLTYDFENKIKPIIAVYEGMGLSKSDLSAMLQLRPTLIPRTSFDDEKMEYIRKTGIPQTSKMYKYVVTLIGVSRVETIHKKVANLERFGFSEKEVVELIGRCPLMLTLSVDKVQRNMTFVLGTMKLPAEMVLQYPYLLLANLETVLRPRVLLAEKMNEMGLELRINAGDMMRAWRMKEKRFLKAFVTSQSEDVADELKKFYDSAKRMKRLAVTSKKNANHGFPF